MSKQKVYIIASYAATPKNPKFTNKPGYMKDANNIKWNESIAIKVGLKTKDLVNSKVVLNITDQKIERNAFNNERTFMEYFDYFYRANPQQMSQALQSLGFTIGTPNESQNVPDNVVETINGSESTSEVNVSADVPTEAEAS